MHNRFARFSRAITEINRCWHKLAAEETAKFELNIPHALYLNALFTHTDGITASQLGETCCTDKADVSRMVSILEKKGLVYKETVGHSRYRAKLFLTEAGKAAANHIRQRAALAVARSGAGLTEEEREIFYRALEQIADNMHALCKEGLPEQKGCCTMNDYIIFADSCCDVSPELLAEWGVPFANMTFTFEGDDKSYIDTDISNKEFYDRMRQGAVAKTAAINTDAFIRAFTPILQEGKDILYVAFSSGLSTTVSCAHMAAEDLREQFPDRKIVIVDTLAASAGGGLMTYMAVEKKKAGASLEENAAYLESLVPQHCIWFIVDDLEYLKRGGRVSPLVAFAGGLLGIKPVLQMDSEGHLIKVSTARGRKKAIEALAAKYAELSYEEKNTPIFISYGDCEEDAKILVDLLEKQGGKTTLLTKIGPVIGSHSGPGTIALFFIGKHR